MSAKRDTSSPSGALEAVSLAVLFDALANGRATVLVDAASAEAVALPNAQQCDAAEFSARWADRDPTRPGVWALREVDEKLLDEDPPALLILTGPESPSCGVPMLGPAGELRLDTKAEPPAPIACAPDRVELGGLRRALGSPALELAPTPTWLPAALEAEAFRGRALVGYVFAEVLDAAWSTWAARFAQASCVVPLGLTPFDPDASHEELEPAKIEALAAAHALERWTGSVFPAPRVLARVVANATTAKPEPVTPTQAALWRQTGRALPRLASAVGMSEPESGLDLDPPTAAFFAQRARVRRSAAEEALASGAPVVAEVDPAARSRAMDVLEAAGEVLSDHESKVVLRGFGLAVTKQAVASSASGAAQFADRIGYPVVLKALAPGLRRKRELGAIALDVPNAAAVRRTHSAIVAAVEDRAPSARLDGVVVAEMVGAGIEVHAGLRRIDAERVALWGQPVGFDVPVEPLLFAFGPDTPTRESVHAFAHAVLASSPLPALRRASDPDAGVLAGVYLALVSMVDALGESLRSVHLGPLRLLADRESRDYVVLDARVEQTRAL